MPQQTYTNPDSIALLGNVTISKDYAAQTSGNAVLTINGPLIGDNGSGSSLFQSDGSGNVTCVNLTATTSLVGTQTSISLVNLTATGTLAASILGGGVLNAGATSLAATIVNNATIATTGRVQRVLATAACTSAAVAVGTVNGQDLTILCLGATNITASTNIISANAASLVMSFGNAYGLVWDQTGAAGTGSWYHKV